MLIHRLATVLALSATISSSLALGSPYPTPTTSIPNANLIGWTPKPTREPQVLLKPLRRNANDALCGYVQGFADYPISCAHGSCQYNTALNWFGCCSAGSSGDDDKDEKSCNMATRCVESASVSSCLADASCSGDRHALGCTEASAPFCVQVNTVRARATLSHFVCAPAATVLALRAEPTGGDAAKAKGGGHGEEDASGSMGVGNDGVKPTAGSRDEKKAGSNNAVASSLANAGATMQSVRDVVGVVGGGLLGLAAMLF